MSLLKVRVTRDDIRKGEPWRCDACPVARAMRRHGYQKVFVDMSMISTRWKTFRTPALVRRFMLQFDRHRPVKPFSFALRAI